MSETVTSLLAKAERRRSDRSTFDSHAEQIRELFYPLAASFVTQLVPGQKLHQKVLDSTPEQALDLLVAGMLARLTSPDERWFALSPLDADLKEVEPVRRWLDAVEDRLFGVFTSTTSNFTPQQHEKYTELASLGTGVMFIAEQPGVDVPVFQTHPLAHCYLDENSRGLVDTVDRWVTYSARQAVQEFGNAAGRKVLEAAREPKRQHEQFQFVHCVYPRSDRDPGKADTRNMAFASSWVNVTERELVRESGFNEFPYTTPRWTKRAGQIYGSGPGQKTLADARMLQRTMKVTIQGAEKIINPPLIVADDGVLTPLRMGPNGVNYVRADLMDDRRMPIRSFDSGARPDIGEDFMTAVRKRIEAGFFVPLLQFARDPRMTATQVLRIDEQTQIALSPLLARLQVEDLNPMIQRVYAIELRNGRLPEPPPEIQGRDLKIEYVSPLARLAKVSRARAIAESIELLAPLIAQKPEMLDHFDTDKIAREVPQLLGAPTDWMRSVEQVQEIRTARAEAADAMAQGDAALKMTEGARNLAPALQAVQGLAPGSEVAGNA
jgi:hypothetical protein